MRSLPGIYCLSVCALLGSAAPARSAFHDWRIKEIFSSADGTVQFIEFFTTSAGQQFLDGHTIDISSDGGPPVSFTLNGGLTVPAGQSTANRHFLVATAGFGALAGGVAPNYFPLPANFINLNATNISISFAHDFDTTTFAVSLLPKDGVNSLTDTVTSVFPADTDNYVVTLNSPTNFLNASGSVNVGGPSFQEGDFNESGSVTGADLDNWRAGYGMQGASVDHTDGDANDDDDVDGGDFLLWQQQLGVPPIVAAGGAVPEPAAGLLAGLAALTLAAVRRRAA